jgi:3-deoxy-D-manno-octulosonic-acid transferase
MSARLVLYNILILTIGILALPWIVYQILFVRRRRTGLAQRLGASPMFSDPTIWCHAVSVGEVKAIIPMLSLFEKSGKTRGRVVVSTVTPTGQETAKRECGFVKEIFYFPFDIPFLVGRVIQRINPEVFITAETEIWPNFFFTCFRRKIPVVIVNGRISDGSFPRYMKFRWFFRPILKRVTLFLMQSDEDARRIMDIGAREVSVKVTGNMKYDRSPEPVTLPKAINSWAHGGFLLVAGSTHAGEEEMLLHALKENEITDLYLAIVPRHPERFDDVARLLETENYLYSRFSELLAGRPPQGNIMLVDAMGVLDGFYALADAAFVGGSLVPVGGHNLLEPAMHRVPVITGPHIHNFRDISGALVKAGGCEVVRDSEALSVFVHTLVVDREKRDDMGDAARNACEATKGASEKNAWMIMGIQNRSGCDQES